MSFLKIQLGSKINEKIFQKLMIYIFITLTTVYSKKNIHNYTSFE